MTITAVWQRRGAVWQRRGIAAAIVALLAFALVWIAPPARADGDPSQDVVRSLDVHYRIDETGTLFVEETFEWDFGSRNGLGFYRALVQQMGWEHDTSMARVLRYENFEVHSPSGAPAEIWVESSYGSMLRLAVGAPDGSTDTRTGVQTYVLSYEVEGAINAVRGQEGVADQDELFYNVFNDLPNRLDEVTVTVSGPADVVDVACYSGAYGDDSPCSGYSSSGSTATFSESGVSRGGGLTIMAAYPADTFTNPGPILEPRPGGGSSGGPIPGDPSYQPGFVDRVGNFLGKYWPAAAGAWAALIAGIAALRVRGGRDYIYQGIAPGQMPAEGAPAQEVRMTSEPPVAVRFHPPDGLHPAEAEVIEEEHVTDEAFTATMVDLAVRGYFTIAPAKTTRAGNVTDWELTLNPNGPPRSELEQFEDRVMTSFFGKGRTVRISSLRGEFASKIGQFNSALTQRSDSAEWFTRSGLARNLKVGGWFTVAFFIIVMFIQSGGAAFASITSSRNLLPMVIAGMVAVVSLIVVFVATSKAAHARSAHGRALYEQIRGFREYLTTAEAHQLRWEAGEDIFSKYLPWAIIFGVADRWTSLFSRLAAEGVYTYHPTWYVGYGPGNPAMQVRSIGDSVKSLGTTGMSALTYTPGSSGSSGSFGGGGGFSGGGVGGGSFGGR
ncbi:MAG TPA: DUF2207 domain-containing protein [Actinomycetales bacterium]|nr:DUF2207 domain-containing protein [Actinomycetales bacterium]